VEGLKRRKVGALADETDRGLRPLRKKRELEAIQGPQPHVGPKKKGGRGDEYRGEGRGVLGYSFARLYCNGGGRK